MENITAVYYVVSTLCQTLIVTVTVYKLVQIRRRNRRK